MRNDINDECPKDSPHNKHAMSVQQISEGEQQYMSVIPTAVSNMGGMVGLCKQLKHMTGATRVNLAWYNKESKSLAGPTDFINGGEGRQLAIGAGMKEVDTSGDVRESLQRALDEACPGFSLEFQQRSGKLTLRIFLELPADYLAKKTGSDMEGVMARIAAEFPEAVLSIHSDKKEEEEDTGAYGDVGSAFHAEFHAFPTDILNSLMDGLPDAAPVPAAAATGPGDLQAYAPEAAAKDAAASFWF